MGHDRAAAPAPSAPPEPSSGPVDADRPEAAGASVDSVVALAGVDWWYHNRGHSECQVLRRLAGRTTVLWVNSIGMRRPRPGHTEIAGTRILRKIKSTLKGLRRDESGMWVLSPIFVPAYSERALQFNGWLVRAQVALVMRLLGMKRPSAWITLPTAAPTLLGRRWRRIVFNRSDLFSEFPDVDTEQVAELERQILEASTEVVYVNHELFEAERGRSRSSSFLGHGVDFDHFAIERGVPPTSIAELPRPLIGFYGALDEFTVDLDLLVATARAHPEGTVLVLGPQQMDLDRLLAEPNVTFLGPIPYEDLPSYASHFDVGVMPWLRNEWIERSNPIKLKEYLALGFPVASIDFPELAPYHELVHAATDTESFLAAVDAALADTDPDRRAERRTAVAESSWDAVADTVAVHLGLRG